MKTAQTPAVSSQRPQETAEGYARRIADEQPAAQSAHTPKLLARVARFDSLGLPDDQESPPSVSVGDLREIVNAYASLTSEVAQLRAALEKALPCVEYAEIETAAKGQTAAHEKCLTALDWMRPY